MSKIKDILTEKPFQEKERHGSPVYSCPLFEALKKVINTDFNAKRNGIVMSQYGVRITVFQGNPNNVWGMFEVRNANKENEDPEYDIRIFSSILRKILKQNEITADFIKEIL